MLPKPLNNLLLLIFKMFTGSSDSCSTQQQSGCSHPLPPHAPWGAVKHWRCLLQAEHCAAGRSETWLGAVHWLLMHKHSKRADRAGSKMHGLLIHELVLEKGTVAQGSYELPYPAVSLTL